MNIYSKMIQIFHLLFSLFMVLQNTLNLQQISINILKKAYLIKYHIVIRLYYFLVVRSSCKNAFKKVFNCIDIVIFLSSKVEFFFVFEVFFFLGFLLVILFFFLFYFLYKNLIFFFLLLLSTQPL